MSDVLIRILLLAMTVATLLGWVSSLPLLGAPVARLGRGSLRLSLCVGVTLAALLIFLFRWFYVQQHWAPLSAHLDGLLLVAVLLGLCAIFIETRDRLRTVNLALLPVWAFILGWAWCAATWTYQPFLSDVTRLWQTLHLLAVYIGTASAAIGAIAGATWLIARQRVRHKQVDHGDRAWASLETLEGLVVRAATLGFVLLSLALASGLIILISQEHHGMGTWYSAPKIWLGLIVWAIYALVMNVRYASHFRGSRAAWLSLIGFALLIVTYSLILLLASQPSADPAVIELSGLLARQEAPCAS